MKDVASRKLIHRHSFAYLLVVPVLLAVATGVLLFMHSDLNLAMLYSQCKSRSRLQAVSRIPLVGPPACFIVSFFHAALDSFRSSASMSVVLAFFAGLLTVSTVESARICNYSNVLIAYPTGPWLIFNLIGGALIWELVIIPASFHRSRELLQICNEVEAVTGQAGSGPHTTEVCAIDPQNPGLGPERRHLKMMAEVFAIPISVGVGFVATSTVMLVFKSPFTIGIWLFFPVYVSLMRQGMRWVTARWLESHKKSFHLESHGPSLALMYAIPIACSIAAHGWAIWSLTTRDDRNSMTKSAVAFVEIDTLFILLTVLYWVVVEAGWRVALVMAAVTLVLGPGAGVSLGWIYREWHVGDFKLDYGNSGPGSRDEENSGRGGPDEQTPLLDCGQAGSE